MLIYIEVNLIDNLMLVKIYRQTTVNYLLKTGIKINLETRFKNENLE